MDCSETRFDHFTQALATGLSRRQALKWAAAGVVGATLSTLRLRKAEARVCPTAAEGSCPVCEGQLPCKSEGCSCIPKTGSGSCFCHQFQICADMTPCNRTRDCKALFGRGWKCAHSCCDQFGFPPLCLPKCGLAAANADAVRAAAALRRGLTTAG